MIKKWVTVLSWKNGIAIVKYDVNNSCKNCIYSADCCSNILNKFELQTNHIISIFSEQTLFKGQRIELGIKERSLLLSAMIAYLSPLFGLFLMAGFFQALFSTNLAAICGCVLGVICGFLLAHSFSYKLIKREYQQITILNISMPP